MTTSRPVRLLIVDDYEVIRAGLRTLLAPYDDLHIVGEAATNRTVIQRCAELCPDVVLLDYTLDEGDGAQLARQLRKRFPEVRIIMLACMFELASMHQIIESGAAGYLIKNATAEQLAAAVRLIMQGEPVFAPEVLHHLLRANLGMEPRIDLTDRERDILALIVRGHTNKEIGQRLALSPFTVKNHISRLLRKLGAASRAEAGALALKLHLVQMD